MFRKLGVPFARVAPGAVDDANVEKLMGVTSSTLETLFRQFLKLLYQANQPLKPEPSAANPKMDELVKVLLSLLKENEAVKAQLSSAVEKLEGNKAAPESATLKEVMDMAKKGQEGVTAYADVWSRIYTATRTLLDFLQS